MPRNKVAWRRLVFVALIIVALALLTVSFRETSSGPVHSIQQAGLSALAPLQSLGAKAAKPFQDGYHWVTTLWSAHRDNEKLSADLQKLQGEAVQLQELDQENARLRGLLDFHDSTIFPMGTTFKVAAVVGKAPTLWESWVLIDKGSADGIAVDQAVVGATPIAGSTSLSGKGLVGKVIEVTAHSAKVQLITDSESSVAATIEGPRAQGIVQGSASGKITMEYVDRDQNVDPKLVIVTSGFGGVYPKGIPIGIVASVGGEDVNIYKQIEVQAFVDFRVLEEVMVVTSTTGTDLAGITGTTDSSTTTSTANTAATTVTTATTIPPSNTSTTKGQ